MKTGGQRDGFTLLELLIAAAITLVLAGILLGLSTGTLIVWKRTQDDFSQTTQARLALDFIERDLQAAFLRVERGGTWLAVDYQSTTSTLGVHGWTLTGTRMKPAGTTSWRQPASAGDDMAISSARFGVGGAWLRFVTARDGTSTEIAAPSVVGYQIMRRPVSSSSLALAREDLRYALYRAIVRVNTSGTRPGVFQAGYDLQGSSYTTPSGQQGDPGTVVSPNLSDALASNVIDFGAWLYLDDTGSPNGLRRVFPLSSVSASYALTATPVPVAADVMLRVLSDEGATLIQAIEQGKLIRPPQFANDDDWWWSVAEANSRVFTRRVQLQGGRNL